MVRARWIFKWFLAFLIGSVILAGSLFPDEGEDRSSVHAAGCWMASISRQWTNLDLIGSVLRVSVEGQVGLPVTLRSLGEFETTGFTGTKPEYGPYVAEFAPLSKGTYIVEPAGLGIALSLWLDGRSYTRVEFTPMACAPAPAPPPPASPSLPTPIPAPPPSEVVPPVLVLPPPTLPQPPFYPPHPPQWQGRVVQHLKKLEGSYFASIVVRVTGRPAGQEVEIRSGDWSSVCKTGTKPEHGPDACEFGALNSGTYRVTPAGLGTYLDVEVELGDFVVVEFYATGGGAGGSQTHWVGSIVEQTSGDEPTGSSNSAIAVVVAGRPWHKVEIRSDGWSTTAETGYKPEYGPDACEFGGLQAGTYTIVPEGLGASIPVTVDGWGWALVRFDQVVVPAPQPVILPLEPPIVTEPFVPPWVPEPTATSEPSSAPSGLGWRGWIISNSSGTRAGTGTWSVIVVRVVNRAGVPVTVTSEGGWSATCTTGTKPEYGPDACEISALWPASYLVRPEGSDVEIEVEMDGQGIAFIDFAAP